ncbi:MAG: hypothetical protein ABEJ57_05885 [Halobacteriaceae archaeon]
MAGREAPVVSRGSTLVTRRARRFVLASPLFLVAWALAVLVELPARTTVPLALQGFVLTMVFGKAYALVPSYFDTTLAPPWAPLLQFPLTVVGAPALAAAGLPGTPAWMGVAGATTWAAGTVVFVATIVYTIRGNPTGAATGTSDVNAARHRIDRIANVGVPVVLAYLLAGSYTLIATHATIPRFGIPAPGATHLLAAGGGALLVFAVGFRLFPRFLAAHPPRGLAPMVLAAGALAPIVIATNLYGGRLFEVGAALQALAVLGWAGSYAVLFWRSDRSRVALYGPLLGAVLGAIGVGLGLQFAYAAVSTDLIVVHRRLNLVGFLGLTIVGAAYQFYPPAVGSFPLAGNRLAAGSMAAIFLGLLTQVGAAVGPASLSTVGEGLVVIGALAYAYLLVGLLAQRYG